MNDPTIHATAVLIGAKAVLIRGPSGAGKSMLAWELIEAARFWSKLTKSDLPHEPYHPERVFHYFCVHLRLAVPPAFVLDISAEWPRKRASIECYQSQFLTGRPAERPNFIDRLEEQAGYWGSLINARYGEPYASREPLGLTTMGGLR